MPLNKSSEVLPEGFKSWKEFNKAKKERKLQKQEYKLKKLEEKKQKELMKASEKSSESVEKICNEPSTLSIAVPGSILENAQSAELRTYLAGQIARAACVFKVDEIVVYDDQGIQDSITTRLVPSLAEDGEVRPARRCCAHLARILQYLECPQYLRKEFFPKHHDLDYAGLLNPLDAPHHMRQQDESRYREGVVTTQPAKNGSYVNVGLLQTVKVDRPLQPGIRVTVEMLPSPPESKRLRGRVVPPSEPLKETGVYWGYSVRLAKSFNAVFTECPYKEGYDVTVGTSERGDPVESVLFPSHKHVLVVFGGLAGIEAALEADDILNVDNPALLFDLYLNTCPNQGSRTIRTEEAILVTLAELRTRLKPKVPPKVFEEDGKNEEETNCYDSDTSNAVLSDKNESFDGTDSERPSTNTFEETDRDHNNGICEVSISSEPCPESLEYHKSKKRKKNKAIIPEEEMEVTSPETVPDSFETCKSKKSKKIEHQLKTEVKQPAEKTHKKSKKKKLSIEG